MPRALRSRRATAAAMIVLGGLAGLLAGAGTAAADELVSNLAEATVDKHALNEKEVAQAFTTGNNTTGYMLESISLYFSGPGQLIGGTGRRMTVYVYLHEDNGSGRPGSQVTTLTKNGINFAGPTEGLNKYMVWKARCYPQPPHGGGCLNDASSVHLKPNTQYWVYVWSGNSQNGADLRSTAHGENSATGWTIANSVLTKPNEGSSSSGYSWTADTLPISFKVEGTTNPAVTVSISDVTVTEGTHATADFVVSLSRATGGPVTFDYETVAGTASDAGNGDFYADDDTLTIQPGRRRRPSPFHSTTTASPRARRNLRCGAQQLEGSKLLR